MKQPRFLNPLKRGSKSFPYGLLKIRELSMKVHGFSFYTYGGIKNSVFERQ